MSSRTHYDALAALFDYPDRDYPARVGAACGAVAARYGEAAGLLEAFGRNLPATGGAFTPEALDEVQEIFTRSFDVQAITTLSVGYVMFGDDYKRGELLVNLNREHASAGVECGTELPDHLPTVLRLIARWTDEALVAEFVEEILGPAVEQMIGEFGPERTVQRNGMYRQHYRTLIASSPDRSTMFRELLAALQAVFKEDFQLATREPPEGTSDFLGSIGRELDIELQEGRPAKARSGS